jgi:hypothetical protein
MNPHRLTRLSLAALLGVAVAIGCNGDDVTGVTASQLAGSWEASGATAGTSFVLTPNDPSFDPLNPLAVGAVVTVTVTEGGVNEGDGSFTLVIDFPDQTGLADITVPGTFTIEGNTITIETPIGTVSGTVSIQTSGGVTTLTIQLDDVNLFDFDGDGGFVGDEDDEAQLDATLEKTEA